MGEEELEILVTMDDPGEDTLEEDTFHVQPQPGDDPSSKQG